MNIMICYVPSTDSLRTVYDIDGRSGSATKLGSYSYAGYVVALPGCVQENDRLIKEESDYLLTEGRAYSQQALELLTEETQSDSNQTQVQKASN